MVTVEEIENFVVEQLYYTDIQRVQNTLEVVFKRENGESVVAITVEGFYSYDFENKLDQ